MWISRATSPNPSRWNKLIFMTDSKLSPFWWLYVPLAFLLGQILLELSVPDGDRLARLHSESGPHELLQSLALGAGLVFAAKGLFEAGRGKNGLLGGWLALAFLCTFYVFGEEISWGQHLLNWDTPAYWAQFNDQNETNLHNTSAWLDQKPRLILFIGIVTGGLLIPLARRFAPRMLSARFSALYPSNALIVAALGVLVPYMVQKLAELAVGQGPFTRVSELQELYMYYFVALYLYELPGRAFTPRAPEFRA